MKRKSFSALARKREMLYLLETGITPIGCLVIATIVMQIAPLHINSLPSWLDGLSQYLKLIIYSCCTRTYCKEGDMHCTVLYVAVPRPLPRRNSLFSFSFRGTSTYVIPSRTVTSGNWSDRDERFAFPRPSVI